MKLLSGFPLFFISVTYVSCLPFFSSSSRSRNGASCVLSIQQDLNIQQGLTPRLERSLLDFGYIYQIVTPTVKIDPDVKINRVYLPESTAGWIPQEAAVVLNGVTYDDKDKILTLRGRISLTNLLKIREASASLKENMIQLSFGTFRLDKSKQEWYNMFKSNDLGSISGSVKNIKAVHQQNGKDSNQEIIIELSPRSNSTSESLEYTINRMTPAKKINWTTETNKVCEGMYKRTLKNRKDSLYEIIDSAVLL